MLSKCANPPCFAPFRKLREGRLYLVDSERERTADSKPTGMSRAFECLWLCSCCCRDMTIQIDSDHRVAVVYKRAAQNTSSLAILAATVAGSACRFVD